MNKLLTAGRLFVIVFAVLVLVSITPVQAGARGTFRNLYFSGDARNCGDWSVASSPYDDSEWVSFWRPGIVQYTLTDANQRVISQGTVDIFAGFAGYVDGQRLPSFSVPSADWAGARNPLHAVVTVDGDLIADLTADNPCLAASGGQPGGNPPAGSTGACMVRAARSGIRLRGGTGTTYAVLGTLPARQNFAVLAQGRDSAGVVWWQITVPNIGTGWVISTFSVTSGNCSAVPQTAAPPAAPPTVDPATTAACTLASQTSGLRLRGGAGVNYDVVGRIQSGTAYAVTGQNTDGDGVVWWQINVGSAGQAWVISTYVTTRGDCSAVPVVVPPS
ncbi:MAG: hypothetical protein IAE80_07945 [Anaerolinea sp.]|nr:hypothetical protein [Anaerolinea sp.]